MSEHKIGKDAYGREVVLKAIHTLHGPVAWALSASSGRYFRGLTSANIRAMAEVIEREEKEQGK